MSHDRLNLTIRFYPLWSVTGHVPASACMLPAVGKRARSSPDLAKREGASKSPAPGNKLKICWSGYS